MSGGLLCIISAGIIYANRKNLSTKCYKSEKFAVTFTLAVMVIVVSAAELFLLRGH